MPGLKVDERGLLFIEIEIQVYLKVFFKRCSGRYQEIFLQLGFFLVCATYDQNTKRVEKKEHRKKDD